MIATALSSVVPKFLMPLTGADKLERTYRQLQRMNATQPIAERLLDHLQVTYRLGQRDVQQIPRKGPVVVVANHPFGILEGAVLATILRTVRPDVRILANSVLAAVPELRDLVIPVDPMGNRDSLRRSSSGLRKAIEFVAKGGLLVVFPAGEVSHFQWREREVTDPAWNPAVARLVQAVSRCGGAPSVVPVFVGGSNGALFQAASAIHSGLRTALLARELFNKKMKSVDVRIGSVIEGAKLLAIPTADEQVEYLRWRTYLLKNREEFKPRTARPLFARKTVAPQPVATPVQPDLMVSEISKLPPAQVLATSGELTAYISFAAQTPNVLREIGRLREITFRAAGEGTGKSSDTDRFDAHYLHLFLWNERSQEIAGSYRLCGTEVGPERLYTATLFPYRHAFLHNLGPALELGRSFVRVEYQKGFAPLLLLWKGIGAYIARNPHYKTLFGPVSISSQYQSVSRELMVTFLERHASLNNWTGLVWQRNPFRGRTAMPRLPANGCNIEDLSDMVSDMEPNRAGVPVLLRQYLRLGGKLVGFNVDPEFSNALDGLILVDLTKTEPQLLERYLGKQQAAEFLQFQKGNACHIRKAS